MYELVHKRTHHFGYDLYSKGFWPTREGAQKVCDLNNASPKWKGNGLDPEDVNYIPDDIFYVREVTDEDCHNRVGKSFIEEVEYPRLTPREEFYYALLSGQLD